MFVWKELCVLNVGLVEAGNIFNFGTFWLVGLGAIRVLVLQILFSFFILGDNTLANIYFHKRKKIDA